MDDNAKPIKIFLEFEGVDFDFYTFHRMEETDTFNTEQPYGLDFNLVLHFNAPPYKHIFPFATDELRMMKKESLKDKLRNHRIQFI